MNTDLTTSLSAAVDALGTVAAGDAELVGWHTSPIAGPVPLPRLPAACESVNEEAVAHRAETVLPTKRRRFLSHR